MVKLLEKEAAVNTTIFGTTLWNQFLQFMFYAQFDAKFDDLDLLYVWEALLRNWSELALKFLH